MYYLFPFVHEYGEVTIRLTSLTNISDLYVLVNRTDVRPDRDFFHYISQHTGELILQWEERNANY